MDPIKPEPAWMNDDQLDQLERCGVAVPAEVLAMVQELKVRRRAMQAETWRDRPPLL